MPRIKPKTRTTTISCVEDADKALARIAELRRLVARADLALSAGVDALKAKHQEETKPKEREIDDLTDALSIYAEINKSALFTTQKTIRRPFGCFGFRQSTRLVMERGYKRTQLVGLLEEAGMEEYVRLKKTPDIEALRGCTPEMLTLVHARLASKDDFFVDIPEPIQSDDRATA